jgi:hypothetical protein
MFSIGSSQAWTIFRSLSLLEIHEGNWSSQGQTIGMASIAKAVGLPADAERFAWVRSCFAVKARQYATAGFPADVCGLRWP